MKSEQLDKYIGKKVRVFFYDGLIAVGILGHGDVFGKDGWHGKGYHLIPYYITYYEYMGFKKSCVRKIEVNPKIELKEIK